jgi:hypothetical protein
MPCGKQVWILHPQHGKFVITKGKSGPSWKNKNDSEALGLLCEPRHYAKTLQGLVTPKMQKPLSIKWDSLVEKVPLTRQLPREVMPKTTQ